MCSFLQVPHLYHRGLAVGETRKTLLAYACACVGQDVLKTQGLATALWATVELVKPLFSSNFNSFPNSVTSDAVFKFPWTLSDCTDFEIYRLWMSFSCFIKQECSSSKTSHIASLTAYQKHSYFYPSSPFIIVTFTSQALLLKNGEEEEG